MSSLISVIVPVYKTEPYLRKCLKSIIGQTYKNLEIIIVDDGSPDNCGKICDEYAALDSRIKVIHQKNSGISAARNAGLKIASGEYIGFTDSDDWLDADMFETLYNGALEYNADITICGYYFVKGNKYREVREKHTVLYGREDAMHHLLLDETFTNHAWNKLCKRKLFEGVYYPHGRTFEDIATTYKLVEKADNVVFLNSCKYYYLQRDESIVGVGNIDSAADRCLMMYERYMDLMERYPGEKEFLLAGFYMAFADFGYAVSRQREDYFRTYKNDFGEVINFAIENKHAVWKCRVVGRACKLNYTLFLLENRLAFAGIKFFVFLSRLKRIVFPRYRLDKNINIKSL
jgi:glycosyltransferase involved in cell wall biosynthesis